MKKLFVFLCVAGLIAASASPLFAGGIINKQNQSTDYMRTLSRHAATDSPTSLMYNPAGIMKMEDGGYAKLDIMYFSKDYSNTVPSNFGEFDQAFGELSEDEPSIIPGFFAVFKQEKWAVFLPLPSRPGVVNSIMIKAMPERFSLPTELLRVQPHLRRFWCLCRRYNRIDSQKIEVKESTVYGFTFGGSYAINDMWSIAAGARYSNGTESSTARP